MKICHVIYIPRLSGAEILVSDLALSHISQGHEVAIISIEPPENSFANHIKILQNKNVLLKFPEIRLSKIGRLIFLFKNLKFFSPNIVISHSVIPSAYTRVALHFFENVKIPSISVLHDSSQDDYSSAIFRFLEKFIIPSPTSIIALTQNAIENYQRQVGKNIKTKIIKNGVNLDVFRKALLNRNQVRKIIFNAEEQESIFIQIGRFCVAKQQHLSVKSFIKALSQNNFEGKLFLVGLVEDLEYEKSVKNLVREYGLNNKIIFLGPRRDIPDLLAGSDIYLMPSDQEAHSIAFVEALASGITIIGSDISSFQYGLQFEGVKLIQPENTDLYAQEILNTVSLKTDKRWARDLDEYSIEKTSNEYLNLFDSLVTFSK
jgi:L-malate glycosyltransferase